eukprot:TRINITY_DN1337_c0_g3_i2.p1 TRINITY_DN1337_c0_g3~~TRINITY_DN1337_c0_g3_i2.p1  ORF type:complete len:510 (-),score=66.65 TRINITY_DN1337_c0_g3_i2:180-1709(-)
MQVGIFNLRLSGRRRAAFTAGGRNKGRNGSAFVAARHCKGLPVICQAGKLNGVPQEIVSGAQAVILQTPTKEETQNDNSVEDITPTSLETEQAEEKYSLTVDYPSLQSVDNLDVKLHSLHDGTMCVHGGERERRPRVSDCLTTPICQTSTFFFKNTKELIDYQEGTHGSYEYGRYGNPTTRTVESKLSALEGAEDCLLSASGMNTATTLLLALVPAGGHIVTTTDCYRRTRQFIQTVLPRMGISATVIDPSDTQRLAEVLEERKVSLFFSESPTNPYLRVVDIETIVKLCHQHGAKVVLDGTFATPVNMRGIDWGVDYIIHSATKYLAGHNDVLMGSIASSRDDLYKVRQMHNVLGGVVDPHAAYMLLRGLKTLQLRVKCHNESAMEVAKRLEDHPKISRVWYPGLKSHPDHEMAVKYMSGFGGVVSFEVDGDIWRTAKFIDSVRLPYIAPSLGGVESLIEQPAVISYWDQGVEGRARVGIKDNLVRFSVGIEDLEDIWDDLEQALNKI